MTRRHPRVDFDVPFVLCLISTTCSCDTQSTSSRLIRFITGQPETYHHVSSQRAVDQPGLYREGVIFGPFDGRGTPILEIAARESAWHRKFLGVICVANVVPQRAMALSEGALAVEPAALHFTLLTDTTCLMDVCIYDGLRKVFHSTKCLEDFRLLPYFTNEIFWPGKHNGQSTWAGNGSLAMGK